MPRKAQRVRAMLEPMPSPSDRPCGFHAAAKVSELNQNQPMNDKVPTGIMTPQTVTEPIFPVTPGPPKLATVVSHRSAITLMQVAMGVADIPGKKVAK